MGDIYYTLIFDNIKLFKVHDYIWTNLFNDNAVYDRGWCFKTLEECEAFCLRLNEAIKEIKP